MAGPHSLSEAGVGCSAYFGGLGQGWGECSVLAPRDRLHGFHRLAQVQRAGEGRGRCQPPNPERGAGLLPVAWAWFFRPTGC